MAFTYAVSISEGDFSKRAIPSTQTSALGPIDNSGSGARWMKKNQCHKLVATFLRLDGNDLRLRPIEERRSALLRLVVGVSGILFSEALAAEGVVVFAKACELRAPALF